MTVKDSENLRLKHLGRRIERDYIRPIARVLGKRKGRGAKQAGFRPAPEVIQRLAAIFPESARGDLTRDELWGFLGLIFDGAFYKAQFADRLEGDERDAYEHFLRVGIFEDYRPTILFNEDFYRERLERFMRGLDADATVATIAPGVSAFAHWVTIGRHHKIVPTPLFDEARYHRDNPRRWFELKLERWAFENFVRHSRNEYRRTVSAWIEGASPEELKRSSSIELGSVILSDKLERLRSSDAKLLIRKATRIEPLIENRYGHGRLTYVPVLSPIGPVVQRASAIRACLGVAEADTIVLIPHCRMAGSARVAGQFVQSVVALRPDDTTLVISTDLSDLEYPEWFPSRARLVPLADHLEGLDRRLRVMLLLDVIRGLSPKRVININSRLAWDVYVAYSRQLAKWTSLSCYLFTFDRDKAGNKVGYPISGFEPCAEYLTSTLVDNAPLRDELVERGAVPSRIHVVHTPVETVAFDHSSLVREMTPGRRLQAFWAGRFDRQKRLDIVVEVARAMPEIDIRAWGKEVLGGATVDFDALPSNIKLQGTYRDFDDLPLAEFDFFFYTSEWDGLPTILMDVGIRGIPVVASRVGGVSDLISEATGYPVDSQQPADYVAAIRALAADPAEATRRARALRQHTAELCDPALYRRQIGAIFGLSSERVGQTQ